MTVARWSCRSSRGDPRATRRVPLRPTVRGGRLAFSTRGGPDVSEIAWCLRARRSRVRGLCRTSPSRTRWIWPRRPTHQRHRRGRGHVGRGGRRCGRVRSTGRSRSTAPSTATSSSVTASVTVRGARHRRRPRRARRRADHGHTSATTSSRSTAASPTRDGAQVDGDVKSRQEPDVAPGTVTGDVKKLNIQNLFSGILLVFLIYLWIAVTLSVALLGLPVRRCCSPRAADATATAGRRFWPTVGWGALVGIVGPILGVLVLVTIVGIPFGLGMLSALNVLAPLGYVASSLILGRLMVKGTSTGARIGAFFAGFGILRAVALLPGIGVIVWFLVCMYGLGALTQAAWRAGRVAPASPSPAAPEPSPEPPAGARNLTLRPATMRGGDGCRTCAAVDGVVAAAPEHELQVDEHAHDRGPRAPQRRQSFGLDDGEGRDCDDIGDSEPHDRAEAREQWGPAGARRRRARSREWRSGRHRRTGSCARPRGPTRRRARSPPRGTLPAIAPITTKALMRRRRRPGGSRIMIARGARTGRTTQANAT